ncbi:U3 small nucleolar RNA-associated protein 14 homolog A [Bacillus rossius redtenbacheri]|uniref:U3 small nucleolar RNA-associated protein 14 homolog A n=1 Tax=Bacillus rossius redtenbacheri TaxID=93214 RepID=UPI002FDD6032
MVQGRSAERSERLGVDEHESISDGEIPDPKHTALLEAVSQLDGKQRVRAPTRSEPSLQVSEFHLVGSGSSGSSRIRVAELAKTLKKKSSHVETSRKVQLLQSKLKTLPKPLEKNVSEKLRRSVGFENVKTELAKWEAIVESHRSVDTLTFPLRRADDRPTSSNAFIAKLKSQKPNELEAKVAEILAGSPCVQEDAKEQEEEYPLSLEELLEHRKEMAKIRALESYKAVKAARQKKIKSKKFHRLQRREGVRRQIKSFEQLQKCDPEAALRRLEELERGRAEERMTLRHRSTGQWARSKAVRAKYDKEARQVLSEQLAISRELTQKVGREEDSGVDSETEVPEADEPEASTGPGNSKNPWMVKTSSEIDQFVSGYRKFWEEQNKRKAQVESAGKDGAASSEQPENVDPVSQAKRIKLMESVVERVEMLENNHSVGNVDETCVDTQASDGDVLQVEEVTQNKRDDKKLQSNKCASASKTGKEKVNGKVVKNSKLKKFNEHDDSRVMSKKKKLSLVGKEQAKLTDSTTKTRNITSTSSSWVVTAVDTPGEGKKQLKSKNKSKRSRDVSGVDVTETEATSQLATDADVKLDDLFEEAEQRLKRRIEEKLSALQVRGEGETKRAEEPAEADADVAGPSLEMKKSVTRPAVDEELGEVPHRLGGGPAEPGEGDLEELAVQLRAERLAPPAPAIDPNNYLQAKPKHLMSRIPDVMTRGDGAMDDDEEKGVEEDDEAEREKLIAEAFADDDIVAEFRDEKEDMIEKSKPKDIDLTLPGWGAWGGPNIEVSKRKKRRFILKVPKNAPRRDDNKGNLIINEDKDTKIKQHQVSDLPFPFERVQDFEASIRAPVGRNWVPEMAHRKMVLPAVRTKLGAVIEPMDEDMLFRKKKKRGNNKYYPI